MGSAPSYLNMKHYKSLEILTNFQDVKTLRKGKAPIESFLATVLV